ncbi:hypothetical protein FRC03_001422 [Tulasnella sp. 419]|nr:hypothetical protein FRC03_001422 [Tulasnella sp. 419]
MVLSHSKLSDSSSSLTSAGTAILGGAQVSLTLLEKAMDGTSIPFVKGVAGAALEVIKIAKAIQSNREECDSLVERSTSLLVVILGSLAGKLEDAIPAHVKRGVERLTTTFYEVLAQLSIIDKRARSWRAVVYYIDNGEKLKGCCTKLHWAMEEFQVTSKVDSCLKDLERHEELRKGQERIMESQQELHQELQRGRNEVRDGFSAMQEAIIAQNPSNLSSSVLSGVMPPDPRIFGRHEYVDKAVKLLFSAPSAKIAILGPGGMGKTSVALKVIHDSLVVERFGDNRCWVPCEQATSVPLFVELVAKSLNLPPSSVSDRLAEIIAFLKSSKVLIVHLFDNFETPWDIEGQQSNVADVLTAIALIPSVSIIITMRGNQSPSSNTIDWTEPRLPSLTQLDLDAAEEAFLRISPSAKGDPGLTTLLEKLDCMPLAITLMAKLSEAGETISDLLEQWKLERTKLLDQPGGDRRNSIEVSIKLSLDSRSVKGNSDAIGLLSVLAMLPAGAALVRLPDMCPSIPGWRAALRVLRGASLVYDSADKSRIQVLSPIQSYILLHHPLGQEPLKELRHSYYKLVPTDKTTPEHPEFKEVAKELAQEEINMETILINALHDHNEDRGAAIGASLYYSEYLFYQQPRTEIIAEAIQVARAIHSPDLPYCLYYHAGILNRQGSSDVAESLFQEAKDEFIRIGDPGFAAKCSGFLGTLLRDKGQYSEARAVLEEAREVLLALGDINGAAQRLLNIAQTLYAQGDYKSSFSSSEQARSEFIGVDNRVGSLRCQMASGAALGALEDYKAAESTLEEARLGFIDVGDLFHVAWCLTSLGLTFKESGDYTLAMAKYEESAAIFGQIGYQHWVEQSQVAIDELRRLLASK